MFIDVEGAFRTWTREAVSSLKFVTFAFPEGKVVFPIATISRVGGLVQEDVPLDEARLSMQVWASNKKDAFRGTSELVDVLYAASNIQISDDVYLYGVSGINVLFQPSPEVELVRYVVDFTATVRKA